MALSHSGHSFIMIGIVTAISSVFDEARADLLIHDFALIHSVLNLHLYIFYADIEVIKVLLHLSDIQ